MSIGIAKNFSAVSAPTVDYAVFTTPTNSFTFSPKGGATSSLVTANVTGGTPAFTYLWTKISGDPIGISETDASQVTFNANSSNGLFQEAVYKVTVTDSLAAEVETEINVIFDFEN